MKWSKWLNDNWQENNILPPELEPQLAIEILAEYLLGNDWYVSAPVNTKQTNCEIVDSILYKYSKKYKKELKNKLKGDNK